MDLALFFVATLLGAIVAGVAGFAFGLIASAIWLHVIPPAQSAPLIAAFAILIQGATLWKLRHTVQISRLVPFIAGGAIGIIALCIGSTDKVIILSALGAVVMYIISMISLLVLRKKEPAMHRPFKVPLYPWFPIIALILSAICMFAIIWYKIGRASCRERV